MERVSFLGHPPPLPKLLFILSNFPFRKCVKGLISFDQKYRLGSSRSSVTMVLSMKAFNLALNLDHNDVVHVIFLHSVWLFC